MKRTDNGTTPPAAEQAAPETSVLASFGLIGEWVASFEKVKRTTLV
jgi:hypothetical protein